MERMVLVFQTSVNTKRKIKALTALLNDLQNVSGWNFDLNDSDYILRVESQIDISQQIILLLNRKGFKCAPLDD